MKFRTLLSALLCVSALFSTSRADVMNDVPTLVSGGSGAVGAIQADDGISYDAPAGSTVNIGGFTAVGGDISSVVLHVKFSVDSGGYTGTYPIQVNGINTSIIPLDGDTQQAASIDITAGNFKVNTWPEITSLALSFINNDGDSGQSVHFDHAYLVITHTTPLYAPPTWSDEFDDSGPPNPAFWTFEQGLLRNQEAQCYQSNNAWQENGNLIIEGRREQVLNPGYIPGSTAWNTKSQYAQYTSASIKSAGKYSFLYGRMQVRAKIPCYTGAWPAIWTLGDSGEWPNGGECDILEYYSPDSVLANFARGSNTRWSASWDTVKKPVSPFFTATNPNPNWRNEYHVWTMQWDDQNVRLYLDNYLMNTASQASLTNPVTTWGPKEPFKQAHNILLNLALGGAGGDPSGTTFPLRYQIDYVRVWEGLMQNHAPTDIALSPGSVPEGLPIGTVVGNLGATDVDAAEVHSFSLVAGTGDTHNASFEIVFNSDQTKTSVLRTKAVLASADGTTRSIRVRVTDIAGATYDKILTVQLAGQYVIEVAPATLTVPEGGTNSFDVRLRVAPVADVTVDVSRLFGDTDLNVVTGSQLVFTPANGTAWQTVTLSAAEDADRINGTATFLCNDASGAFQNATVLATEADNEPPPITAVVELTNLNPSYDGNAKSVTVTTTPAGLSHILTYGGQFMPPSDAGSYEVVATINDPDYQGSASGTLVIAKAEQTINFAAFGPVLDTATPFALTATTSSGLTVSYNSSNTNVATVSGNTVSIAGPGTTTITASQAGNDNYNAATAVPQIMTVGRANPLAVTTGPYLVLSNQSLSLNGAASQPSDGQTITLYSWDLNHDGTFGDVTGATPSSLSYAIITTTWGMVDGPNTIVLRVTDSSGKTSTVSTTVNVVVSPTWDSNGTADLQTDGGGEWTSPNQWWNGTNNVTWTSGGDAIFGNSGAGGAVSLDSPTTVGSLTFNSFTGTYTLGSAGQTLTLNNGITKNASSNGTAAIISPITLGAAQSWTNDSAALLSIGPDAVTNGGFLLSVGGTGSTAVSGNIGGVGGLTKSGGGTLSLSGSNGYSGTTTVSGGTLALSNANTISAATNVAATGTLQLGHATSMGASTLTLASGATLQLRNDSNTNFTAPIATPAGTVTYNFDVNNAGSAVTGKTLTLGNLTFASNTANQLNFTGENSYTLGLGTLSAPSGSGGPWAFTINATTAAVTIAKFTTGSYGSTLALQGGNAITLTNFEMGSNSPNSLTVSGSGTLATLGSTTQINNRSGGTAAYTLTSGTLNLTTTASLANVRAVSGALSAPTFAINGGTLNNTSGSALTLAASPGTGTVAGSPTITLGGNFTFGTALSTSANNLNLGTGAITNAGNRTITFAGSGTTLTLGGTMTNGVGGNQTTTVNGAGNTLSLGAYNLSNNTTSRIDVINGTGNVKITGVIANGGGSTASGLTYSGSGTLTLDGLNTYSGKTTVSGGTLEISSTGTLYSGTGAAYVVQVDSGATLKLAAWNYGATGGIGNSWFGATTLLVNGGTITYANPGAAESVISNSGRPITIGTGGATLNAASSALWTITATDLTYKDQNIANGLTLTGSNNGQYDKNLTGTGGTLTKSGTGTWTLTGTNTYTGITTVSNGKLFINGSLSNTSVALNVNNGATLGGTGTIGRNVSIAEGGKLEFNLSTVAASHDRLDISTGRSFAFAGASVLTITSSAGASPGSYTLITGGANISGVAPATLNLPAGWAATISISGNSLLLNVTATESAPPTLASIADDKSGGPVTVNTLVTYTVTFSKDMDASTVTADDFGNAGSAAVSIGAVTETSPNSGVFTVLATPTSAGTLQLRVNQNAVLTDTAGNALVTTSAIPDDTTLTVRTPYQAWLIANSKAGTAEHLKEYAFGTTTAGSIVVTNPTAITLGQTPAMTITGTAVSAVFGRRQNHQASGLTYKVKFSADLSAWHDSTDTANLMYAGNPDLAHPAVIATQGGMDAVSIPFPLFIKTNNGYEKTNSFMTIEVTTP